MAKLTSSFSFTGTLDGLSCFRMEGVDRPVVRRKGGAPRDKILHDPCFKNTRRNLGEFGGRGPATRYVLQAVQPLRPGLRTAGQINKILCAVQKLDTVAPWGRRSVALTRCPQLLQGLNISGRLAWEEVVRSETMHAVDRTALSARLAVPPLLPGVNCLHPKAYPFFRVVAVLGLVPDLAYTEALDAWAPGEGFTAVAAQHRETPWVQAARSSEAAVLDLALPRHPGIENFSLLLSAAIQYGKLGTNGDVEPLPKAVASRILVVG
jgi:hypothetical protein